MNLRDIYIYIYIYISAKIVVTKFSNRILKATKALITVSSTKLSALGNTQTNKSRNDYKYKNEYEN